MIVWLARSWPVSGGTVYHDVQTHRRRDWQHAACGQRTAEVIKRGDGTNDILYPGVWIDLRLLDPSEVRPCKRCWPEGVRS